MPSCGNPNLSLIRVSSRNVAKPDRINLPEEKKPRNTPFGAKKNVAK
jgi:hypothetical protein